MYWYVLFTRTGREEKVEQFLKKQLDNDVFMPFIPMLQLIFINSGRVKEELKPLFPGYVFIQSEVVGQEFLKEIRTSVYTTDDIFRVLKYSDTKIALKQSEKQMLLSLCNDDFFIESSCGFIEGDRVYIIEGPLKGFESIIRKIDRHKRIASIEIEFMGDIRLVHVGLEIIRKV